MIEKEPKSEITINIQPLLLPISILLSTIIFSSSFLIGMNSLATAYRGGTPSVAGTTTQDAPLPTGTTANVTIDQIRGLITPENLAFGNPDSKVIFAEFSDPSCPYCHIASGKNPSLNTSAGAQFQLVADGGTYLAPVPEMKKLVDEGKAAYVWMYTNGHGNGELGTKAMYCADEQDKFWPVHDKLMTAEGYAILNDVVKNDKSKSAQLANFLSDAIDSGFMTSCLESGRYDSRIAGDASVSRSFGVSGTPGFFVNTTNFAGAYSYESMAPVVEEALK